MKVVRLLPKIAPLTRITHYYHWLHGYFMPLIVFDQTHQGIYENYVVNSGPFNHLVREVFPNALFRGIGVQVLQNEESIKLHRLDKAWTRKRQKLRKSFQLAKDNLAAKGFEFKKSNGTVIFIDRGTDKFHKASKIRSGARRRHLRNADILFDVLQERYGDKTLRVTLENKTLREQIALFSSASLIVAQHGASLSNICFCHMGTKVLEIKESQRHFSSLCRKLRFRYEPILTKEPHPIIEIEKFNEALQKLDEPPRKLI